MKSLFYIILFSVALYACSEGKPSQNNESEQIADTLVVENVQQSEDTTLVDEDVVEEDVVIDVWKAYLKSEYCDVQTDNIESTLALLDKRSNTVAMLELDGSNHPIVREITSDNDDEEDYYEETAVEFFACYPLKNGGWLALWYYDGADWGRRVFAVYKYENNVLTRQKNAFPPFDSYFIDKNPSFDWDELVKLSGTEVVYFMQDCWTCGFYDDHFCISLGGMEETTYKFDGEKFVKE